MSEPVDPFDELQSKGWPPGAYTFGPSKANYVSYKGAQAGPFTQLSEWHDWKRRVDQPDANMDAADQATAATNYTGRFPASNFIHGPNEGAEAAFIYAANRLYAQKHSDTEYIHRRAGLFSGTDADINRLINYGEQEQIFLHKSFDDTVRDFPATPLKEAVMRALS
jgi:hypothetical protein